jgi:hypothetical protein
VKVKDIILLLQQCDPEAEVVINAPHQGFESITVVHRRDKATVVHRQDKHSGVGMRLSFEDIATVEVTNGNVAHMRGQGMDVLGLGDPAPCTCFTCRNFQED